MPAQVIQCTRCGDCCKTVPCLFSQKLFGYPVLLGLQCPALIIHKDNTTSCKLIKFCPNIAKEMLDTGCEKPFTENPMTFQSVLMECMMKKELVEQFNRLRGFSLNFIPKQSSGIVRMIDEACGFDDIKKLQAQNKPEELHEFIQFVFNCMWMPMMMEEFEK